MTKRFLTLFLFSACFAAFPPLLCRADDDVTNKLEDLGIPHKERFPDGEKAYARNIWDMISYQGRIYLGCGAYDNVPPAANAGPVPVIAWDTETNSFVTEENRLPDEQLDNFKVFSDGLLYAPGIDPRQGWDLGNFYRRNADGKWEVVRTMPKGVHNFDMTEFDNKIFSCGYGIAISENRGKTMLLRELGLERVRTYVFLRFPERLFSARIFAFEQNGEEFFAEMNVYVPEKKDFDAIKISSEDLFPGLSKTFRLPEDFKPKPDQKPFFGAFIRRTFEFQNRVLYSVGSRDGFFLYSAENPEGNRFNTARIPLPENTKPEDLYVHEDALYLLTSTANLKPGETLKPGEIPEFINQVWMSTDGIHFEPLFHFRAPLFARSFAISGSDFYFGLGTHYKRDPQTGKWDGTPISSDCGRIYRFRMP
ncbi:MAG: hypothetical protein Q4D38_07095 [Planctomycetia bacterium]|nr:hypothetical protein [Planctomycetia bacterium]